MQILFVHVGFDKTNWQYESLKNVLNSFYFLLSNKTQESCWKPFIYI